MAEELERRQLITPNDCVHTNATQWGFRVMAINSVVERNVADGTITVVQDGIEDGDWSEMIRVNNDPKLDGVLGRPKLKADLHTPSDRGRTGIQLDWASVTGDHPIPGRIFDGQH